MVKKIKVNIIEKSDNKAERKRRLIKLRGIQKNIYNHIKQLHDM